MINSRRKGKRGELDAAKRLRELGFVDARRGQQFHGGPDSPDVVGAIPGVHLEVKYTEWMSLWQALGQAVLDAGDNVPAVMHRKNGTDWVFVVPASCLHRFCSAVAAVGASLLARDA